MIVNLAHSPVTLEYVHTWANLHARSLQSQNTRSKRGHSAKLDTDDRVWKVRCCVSAVASPTPRLLCAVGEKRLPMLVDNELTETLKARDSGSLFTLRVLSVLQNCSSAEWSGTRTHGPSASDVSCGNVQATTG